MSNIKYTPGSLKMQIIQSREFSIEMLYSMMFKYYISFKEISMFPLRWKSKRKKEK